MNAIYPSSGNLCQGALKLFSGVVVHQHITKVVCDPSALEVLKARNSSLPTLAKEPQFDFLSES